MTATRPGCPGCGEAPTRGATFCTLCWTAVPATTRASIERTQKAMGKNPASRRVREEYATALADALRHIR